MSNAVMFRPVPGKTVIRAHAKRIKSAAQHRVFVKAAGAGRRTLPDYFNWADMNSVVAERFRTLAVPMNRVLLDPIDQGICGNCYAVSSATAMSSRYSIWSMTTPQRLSASQLTDCMSVVPGATSQACQGGNPIDCAKFMMTTGVMADTRYGTRSSGENDNSPAALPAKCTQKGDVFAQNGRVLNLGDIESLKSELFHFGPVVVIYKMWDDFNYLTFGNMHLWPETNNIYIRGAYKGRAQMTPTAWFQKYKATMPHLNLTDAELKTYEQAFPKQSRASWQDYWKLAHQKNNGEVVNDNDDSVLAHAVTIVGWGMDRNVPGYGPVEYWIVQNSWGTNWNDKGYFKIAFTQQKQLAGYYAPIKDPSNPNKNLQEGVRIDVVKGYEFGGNYVWNPLVKEGQATLKGPKIPASDNALVGAPGPTPTTNGNYIPLAVWNGQGVAPPSSPPSPPSPPSPSPTSEQTTTPPEPEESKSSTGSAKFPEWAIGAIVAGGSVLLIVGGYLYFRPSTSNPPSTSTLTLTPPGPSFGPPSASSRSRSVPFRI